MVKEKWSQDPNGEAWARDEDKFGKRMLESMGWTDGKGLGADESGATSHVKVKKRGAKIGLGADINTVDKWAEHVTAFDEILGNLNKSAPNSAPSSAPNSQPPSDTEELASKKQKRQKKAKNVYTKFKKHKNLSTLSSADMAHIFGEKKEQVGTASSSAIDRSSPEPADIPVLGLSSAAPPGLTSPPVSGLTSPPVSGLVTINSTMSLSDYFKSKKANVSKCADTFQVSSLFSDTNEGPQASEKKAAEPVSVAPKSDSQMLTHPSRSLENTSSSTGALFTIKGSDKKFSKSSKKARKQRYG